MKCCFVPCRSQHDSCNWKLPALQKCAAAFGLTSGNLDLLLGPLAVVLSAALFPVMLSCYIVPSRVFSSGTYETRFVFLANQIETDETRVSWNGWKTHTEF